MRILNRSNLMNVASRPHGMASHSLVGLEPHRPPWTALEKSPASGRLECYTERGTYTPYMIAVVKQSSAIGVSIRSNRRTAYYHIIPL